MKEEPEKHDRDLLLHGRKRNKVPDAAGRFSNTGPQQKVQDMLRLDPALRAAYYDDVHAFAAVMGAL